MTANLTPTGRALRRALLTRGSFETGILRLGPERQCSMHLGGPVDFDGANMGSRVLQLYYTFNLPLHFYFISASAGIPAPRESH